LWSRRGRLPEGLGQPRQPTVHASSRHARCRERRGSDDRGGGTPHSRPPRWQLSVPVLASALASMFLHIPDERGKYRDRRVCTRNRPTNGGHAVSTGCQTFQHLLCAANLTNVGDVLAGFTRQAL